MQIVVITSKQLCSYSFFVFCIHRQWPIIVLSRKYKVTFEKTELSFLEDKRITRMEIVLR